VFAFWTPGPVEIIVILVIALLLFGKRLPEVGRSLGRGIIEFKKGIKGIEEDIEEQSSRPTHLPPAQALDDEYRSPDQDTPGNDITERDRGVNGPAEPGGTEKKNAPNEPTTETTGETK
jgi:sec-independent protein translocase protein TatA